MEHNSKSLNVNGSIGAGGTIVLILFIISMFFIFGGEPDIYDIWQDKVKGNCIKIEGEQ